MRARWSIPSVLLGIVADVNSQSIESDHGGGRWIESRPTRRLFSCRHVFVFQGMAGTQQASPIATNFARERKARDPRSTDHSSITCVQPSVQPLNGHEKAKNVIEKTVIQRIKRVGKATNGLDERDGGLENGRGGGGIEKVEMGSPQPPCRFADKEKSIRCGNVKRSMRHLIEDSPALQHFCQRGRLGKIFQNRPKKGPLDVSMRRVGDGGHPYFLTWMIQVDRSRQ